MPLNLPRPIQVLARSPLSLISALVHFSDPRLWPLAACPWPLWSSTTLVRGMSFSAQHVSAPMLCRSGAQPLFRSAFVVRTRSGNQPRRHPARSCVQPLLRLLCGARSLWLAGHSSTGLIRHLAIYGSALWDTLAIGARRRSSAHPLRSSAALILAPVFIHYGCHDHCIVKLF